MPGEADRLKKENEELNKLLEQSLVDNQRLLDAGRANLNTNLLLQKQVEELEERCQLEAKEVADLTRWLDAVGLERDALKEENAQLLLSNGALQVRLNHSTPHGRPDPEVEAMRELRDKAVRQAMEVREEMKELKKEEALRYYDNLSARIEMLKADLGSLASREDQRAEALRVQMLGITSRLDELAAAYDAWDLMRDDQTARIRTLEGEVRGLTEDLIEEKRRRWKR